MHQSRLRRRRLFVQLRGSTHTLGRSASHYHMSLTVTDILPRFYLHLSFFPSSNSLTNDQPSSLAHDLSAVQLSEVLQCYIKYSDRSNRFRCLQLWRKYEMILHA